MKLEQKALPHSELTSTIIGACFDISNELGIGFLESVYKNALLVLLKQSNLTVNDEMSFEVVFRGHTIGLYRADLVVGNKVVIEVKSCKCLLPEHQAQIINYLKVSGLPVGLLVNFGSKQVEYRRFDHPQLHRTV